MFDRFFSPLRRRADRLRGETNTEINQHQTHDNIILAVVAAVAAASLRVAAADVAAAVAFAVVAVSNKTAH